MITGISESKTLAKHVSCNCECNPIVQNVIQIKSGMTINVDVSVKIRKNTLCAKRVVFRILLYL